MSPPSTASFIHFSSIITCATGSQIVMMAVMNSVAMRSASSGHTSLSPATCASHAATLTTAPVAICISSAPYLVVVCLFLKFVTVDEIVQMGQMKALLFAHIAHVTSFHQLWKIIKPLPTMQWGNQMEYLVLVLISEHTMCVMAGLIAKRLRMNI